ncbi:M28 family metallopeptidase [Maribacter sp. CXY002]|uniref:M28 family metallopeptidase n=1 Tax=Maribacter luteocoastalis TaxID=3407671 RepID=UPI003B66C613
MKITLGLLCLFFLISCGPGKVASETVLNPVGGPDGLKGKVLETNGEPASNKSSKTESSNSEHDGFSSAADIKKIMDFLASDELQGRDSGSKGIAEAANYIEGVFAKNSISPFFGTFKDTLSNFDAVAYNVVGFLEGNDPVLKNEFIILGAHYDHIGILNPEQGDEIANGANDNASGTTTVLEMARYFGANKSNKRSVIFALFSAEEKGLLGSRHLAQKLKSNGLNLYAMLNFEMVGVPMVGKDHLVYLTGYELSNLAAISNKYANEKLVGFLPKAKEFNLFKRSDNLPFHEMFNVPSQTYSTFDFTNFDHYHKVGDENGLMDYKHMAKVVNKMIPVLEGVSNASVKELKYN